MSQGEDSCFGDGAVLQTCLDDFMVNIQRDAHLFTPPMFSVRYVAINPCSLGSKARVRIPVEEGYAPATVWFLIELKPGGKEERAARGRDEARPLFSILTL